MSIFYLDQPLEESRRHPVFSLALYSAYKKPLILQNLFLIDWHYFIEIRFLPIIEEG